MLFRFCRFLARTGTLLGDGDGGRFCAAENGDLETGRGSISAVHLKETKPGVFREVPYGTGHVDFVDVIKTAWSQGVRLYNAEFWYVGQEKFKLLYEGKVREVYDIGDKLVIAATDRISAFDL